MSNYNPQAYNSQSLVLLDEEFLASLSEQHHRTIYARIVALDFDENPIDRIEGRVTSGSINIDGSSSVRRTCSLSLVSNNLDVNDFYWGIKTKFTLEIGLQNKLTNKYAFKEDGIYPDIVWFPQGYYVVSSFSSSISTNSCTISISGKDKMSLLNGELGGSLYASIDFGAEEVIEQTAEEIYLETNPSIEKLMTSKYYIKLTSNIGKITENNPNIVAIYTPDKAGCYYKKNGVYYYEDDLENGSHNLYKHYDIYKIPETPDEFFIYLYDGDLCPYNSNTYYYWRGGRGYSIDYNDFPTAGRQYYQYKIVIAPETGESFRVCDLNSPVDIYTPGRYYILKNGNYVLSTTTEQENNQAYYKLKPLYNVYKTYTKEKIPLEKIIREAVHTYAQEPYHNIIINDLDDYGLEQLTYKGDEPLYALYDVQAGQFTQLMDSYSNQDLINYINNMNNFYFYSAETLDIGTQLVIKDGVVKGVYKDGNTYYTDQNGTQHDYDPSSHKLYTILKIEYGMDIGYRLTELVYSGDLISSIGESLTSILDKIKQMLGEFEYFYDIDGRFIFQKKKNYINSSWNQLTTTEDENNEKDVYVDSYNRKFSFNFEGNRLISAIQNSPNLTNLKNDFIVWGKRKGISGAEIPIHARYAIDKKPVYYKNLQGIIYTTNPLLISERENSQNNTYIEVDWREIIYQMAIDYFAGQGCSEENPLSISNEEQGGYSTLTDPSHFLYEVGRRNPYYYPTGQTGYEQYYTDMQGFWRELYNPDYIPVPQYTEGYYNENKQWVQPILEKYNIEYYLNEKNPYNTTEDNLIIKEQKNSISGEARTEYEKYLLNSNDISSNKKRLYWNILVFDQPDTLNFWFDFLDSDTDLSQFAVPQVGDRTKVVNEDKAKAIIYTDIPNFILYDQDERNEYGVCDTNKLARKERDNSGYVFMPYPRGYTQLFTISYRGVSVKDKIDGLLYDNGYCSESISLTTIPVYHLQPNTRIFVQDEDTKINGEYIVDKITVPLTYNGTMSISATKAPKRLY